MDIEIGSGSFNLSDSDGLFVVRVTSPDITVLASSLDGDRNVSGSSSNNTKRLCSVPVEIFLETENGTKQESTQLNAETKITLMGDCNIGEHEFLCMSYVGSDGKMRCESMNIIVTVDEQGNKLYVGTTTHYTPFVMTVSSETPSPSDSSSGQDDSSSGQDNSSGNDHHDVVDAATGLTSTTSLVFLLAVALLVALI